MILFDYSSATARFTNQRCFFFKMRKNVLLSTKSWSVVLILHKDHVGWGFGLIYQEKRVFSLMKHAKIIFSIVVVGENEEIIFLRDIAKDTLFKIKWKMLLLRCAVNRKIILIILHDANFYCKHRSRTRLLIFNLVDLIHYYILMLLIRYPHFSDV